MTGKDLKRAKQLIKLLVIQTPLITDEQVIETVTDDFNKKRAKI